MSRKEIELFNENFEDYVAYVNANQKFPTTSNIAIASTGISLLSWRYNVRKGLYGAENQARLAIFESKMKVKFDSAKVIRNKNKQDQKFYDGVTQSKHPSEPQTLEEYLNGDTRYRHFDVPTYVKIMDYIGERTDQCNFLLLVNEIDGDDPILMKHFIRRYGFNNLEERVLSLLKVLVEKELYVVQLKYGLIPGSLPASFDSIARGMNRSRGRVCEIENKAIRRMRHPARMKVLLKPKEKISCKCSVEHLFVVINRSTHYGGRTSDNIECSMELPVEHLEEVLDIIGYDDTVQLNHVGKRIKSVNTYIEYESLIPSNILKLFKLDPSPIDRILSYTSIVIADAEDIPYVIIKPKPVEHPPIFTGLGTLPGDFDGDPLVDLSIETLVPFTARNIMFGRMRRGF